ncbi:MAG: hypothetical protein P8Y10_15610 [Gemmatimonadales bacterium]
MRTVHFIKMMATDGETLEANQVVAYFNCGRVLNGPRSNGRDVLGVFAQRRETGTLSGGLT